MTAVEDIVRRQLSDSAVKARTLAGVIGWPVGHSLSPRLHGYWLKENNIDGAYVRLAVAPEDFTAVMAVLPEMGFAGWNVTVPYKEIALTAVTRADDHATKIGAVNTVVVTDDGATLGSNTDGFGFLESLGEGAPDWDPEAGPVVLVGAGGAAKSVAWALADAGVPELRIVNRTASRASDLAREIGEIAAPVSWKSRSDALAGAGLVVNATSLGMVGQASLDLPLDALPTNAVVNDLVYAPQTTELLKRAQSRGNHTVGGLGMLLHQARRGFTAWFGPEPSVTLELRDFVAAGLEP
jgi:shikimate dehydrogenase